MSTFIDKPKSPLYEYAFCQGFAQHLERLAGLASPEKWDYIRAHNPSPYPILFNYIQHTFKRVKEEHDSFGQDAQSTKICSASDKTCFNTGLYTANYEPIYGLFGPNGIPGKQDRYLIGFFKESDSNLRQFSQLPDRASYFSDIADLLFDARLPMRINIDHILETPENIQRLPSDLRETDRSYVRTLFDGALITVRKKLAANYKLAIPQYYNGRVQLLIPLTLNPTGQADLALAIYREEQHYAGRTCLTLDMAYNNARLIVKPESDWLRP
ncbi:DUF3825 domain-containing protein [Sporomusa acidovorans]|uniref:DUF3825 domain-containing protein n=1 Tax=Sporomusa acidovorans TaxID=112900 RepID=UPI00088EB788|nr:DUF3825 domain-containing protein [Sporomusa acidovorans]OZC18946.1 hypothetical protein SPACI_30320 [Sporomusa acidovorans DSM 3132]SDD70013.1 protein of unknown function [Sporomusa acidovorans]